MSDAHLFLLVFHLTSKSSLFFLHPTTRAIHSFINSFNVHFPYTHLNKFSTSSERMSRRITIGCSQGLALSNLRKYGLQALKTTYIVCFVDVVVSGTRNERENENELIRKAIFFCMHSRVEFICHQPYLVSRERSLITCQRHINEVFFVAEMSEGRQYR